LCEFFVFVLSGNVTVKKVLLSNTTIKMSIFELRWS
jgi:hypothetical protein